MKLLHFLVQVHERRRGDAAQGHALEEAEGDQHAEGGCQGGEETEDDGGADGPRHRPPAPGTVRDGGPWKNGERQAQRRSGDRERCIRGRDPEFGCESGQHSLQRIQLGEGRQPGEQQGEQDPPVGG